MAGSTAARRAALWISLAAALSAPADGAGIAVLVTRDAEADALRMLLESPVSKQQVASRTLVRGRLEGVPIVIAKTGPGLVNAAMTAQLLIDRAAPDLVISIGLCAAISEVIAPGDMLVAKAAIRHDLGTYTDAGFVHGTSSQSAGALPCRLSAEDPSLWARITSHGSPGLRPVVLASGAGFVRSRYKRQWIATTLHAEAVDMSGAAIAHVAEQNERMWLLIRQVSDRADDRAGGDFVSFASGDVSALIRHTVEICTIWIRGQADAT